MSLSDWERQGWLTQHRPTKREIADLLALIERDLSTSQVPGLGADWRLNIAYNAALQCATAALAACGYRAGREAHHARAIQSLEFTIHADPTLVHQLDIFRRKRNQNAYERAGFVSEQEAREMLVLAEGLRVIITDWLRQEHPELL